MNEAPLTRALPGGLDFVDMIRGRVGYAGHQSDKTLPPFEAPDALV